MNDAILSLIIASASGLLAMCVRYSFYSKCDTIEMCHCCKIHRMVENETNGNNNNEENNEVNINVQPVQPATPQNQTNQKKIFRV